MNPTNLLAETIIRYTASGCMLDKNNILWKIVNGKWIGKRSVCTHDNRTCWLQDTVAENIKTWRCGIDADYSEIFERGE